ncbi:hypothetical protein D3C87_1768150 [compost metagenome]
MSSPRSSGFSRTWVRRAAPVPDVTSPIFQRTVSPAALETRASPSPNVRVVTRRGAVQTSNTRPGDQAKTWTPPTKPSAREGDRAAWLAMAMAARPLGPALASTTGDDDIVAAGAR